MRAASPLYGYFYLPSVSPRLGGFCGDAALGCLRSAQMGVTVRAAEVSLHVLVARLVGVG